MEKVMKKQDLKDAGWILQSMERQYYSIISTLGIVALIPVALFFFAYFAGSSEKAIFIHMIVPFVQGVFVVQLTILACQSRRRFLMLCGNWGSGVFRSGMPILFPKGIPDKDKKDVYLYSVILLGEVVGVYTIFILISFATSMTSRTTVLEFLGRFIRPEATYEQSLWFGAMFEMGIMAGVAFGIGLLSATLWPYPNCSEKVLAQIHEIADAP